jgi:uncharacterized protein (DUF433 family)
MPQVVSIELADEQIERLQRMSQRMGKTLGETTALVLEESLREADFPLIEFRTSATSRQPYVRGTRLPVWQVIRLVRDFDGNAAAVAAQLQCPSANVQEALRYARTYSDEIDAEIAEGSPSYEELKRILPGLHLIEVDS